MAITLEVNNYCSKAMCSSMYQTKQTAETQGMFNGRIWGGRAL